MSVNNTVQVTASGRKAGSAGLAGTSGLVWLALATLAAAVFFRGGLAELGRAWQLPEYSHGPLIPVLSTFLFLRQLKGVPENPGPVTDRWPGVALLAVALLLGLAGNMTQIGDMVAYAMILWTGGILLVSFGWRTGRAFWPPVLHLVYMLPLPGALYYGVSTALQGVSSELGVFFLDQLRIPVFLEGNIIDLGDYKLQVAEACSGLRYLFPIMSFSYIFAVLYRGPVWHKAVLLLSAVPITIVMNSARIALSGIIVRDYGVEYLEGLTHLFEGWVIFVVCVVLLFMLAWAMNATRRGGPGLLEALDLDTAGLGVQAMRVRLVRPSRAMITAAGLGVAFALAWQAVPGRGLVLPERDPFALFPARLGAWEAGQARMLDPAVAQILAADDYHSVSLWRTDPTAGAGAGQPVDLFMAWYKDQMTGGVHSPEACLPGAGWEIARLEQIAAPAGVGLDPRDTLNRAIIQKGVDRMLVYYWYDQQGRRTASGFTAKLELMLGKLRNGRNDSALIRLITPIGPGEDETLAEARLRDALAEVIRPLDRFVPGVPDIL